MGAKKSDVNIELICELIIDGKTYREIAEHIGVSLTKLHYHTSKSEHSVRVREALQISADTYADKGERVLIEAKSTLVEVQRAKELSQFYKWKASKRSASKYGDKMELEHKGESIAPVIIINKGK